MRKFILYIFIVFIFFGNLYSQESGYKKLTKIVIDPGHGGDKPGAKGKHCLEKDITLSVSLKLGKLINEHFPNIKVVYTRKTDIDVDLIKRSQLTNRENADLFLSIHCNASKNTTACGTETFVMGLAKTQANMDAAKKENADILKEANYTENYDGFDPNSPEANIFFALYQNAFLEQSLSFAANIQKEFTSNTKLFDRGVKQAAFLVLYKTSVPSVLTEIGFISNPKEEEYLMSEKGQYEVAISILRAICQYKNKLEGVNVKCPKLSSFLTELLPEKKEEKNVNDTIILSSQKQEKKLVYRVQFLTSEVKIRDNDSRIKDIEDVFVYKEKTLCKYTTGSFQDFDLANKHRKNMQEKGYKDAFVVIFYGNQRISLEKAREIEKQELNN